jgi:hypothetical protein
MPSFGVLLHVTFVRTNVPPKCQFLQELHGTTFQKMAILISSLLIQFVPLFSIVMQYAMLYQINKITLILQFYTDFQNLILENTVFALT